MRRICICTPSPQSIRKKRPRTSSTWALGNLSVVGRAEAVPRTLRVKFMLKRLLASLELALKGCKSVDVTESSLLNVRVNLLHSLLGVVRLA